MMPMSYVPSRQTKLVFDLMHKKISEEQFFKEFPASKENIKTVILDLLKRGLRGKDPDPVHCATPLAYRYGISREYLDLFNSLALEPWHFRHEDIVFALGKLKDPTSVEVLAKTALARHPYLEDDEFFVLGTKSIHALENIQTPEAIRVLGELAMNENEVLRTRAIERLRNLVKNGESEIAKSTAQAALESLNKNH